MTKTLGQTFLISEFRVYFEPETTPKRLLDYMQHSDLPKWDPRKFRFSIPVGFVGWWYSIRFCPYFHASDHFVCHVCLKTITQRGHLILELHLMSPLQSFGWFDQTREFRMEEC